jgi:DNA (cytosine-5)-methyltransferase 1
VLDNLMGFTYLDMFCGGGGSSEGARLAGGTLVGAIDAWDIATQTLSDNFDCEAVRTWRMFPGSKPLSDFPEHVDLLLASPECTNHSPAKGSAPRCEDSKNTANYVLNYARALTPRWLVIENVIQMRNWLGYEPLVAGLVRQGYHVTPQVLDAADFGVPQTRKRLFLMCDLKRKPGLLTIPSGTNRRPARDVVQLNGPWASTVLDNGKRAPATLARFQRGVAALGPNVPFLIVYYGSDGSGGWQSLDKPLRTLTTLDRFGLVTWEDGVAYLRMLQVDELKAAMGFPAEYKLSRGNRRDRIRLLGNGVCPPMMQQVIASLAGVELASAIASVSSIPRHDMRSGSERAPIYARS